MTPRERPQAAPRRAKSVKPAKSATSAKSAKPTKSVKSTKSATSPAGVDAQLAAIERGDGEGELDLGRGVSLHVSSLGKVYFPDAGITKGALMRYYARLSPLLIPHIAGRPLVLKRYPDGIDGPMFFQQDAGAHVPDVVQTQALSTVERGDRQRIIGGDLATLLYTVQLGAIEVHPWLSRIPDIDAADRCLIDLDPGEGVPFSAVVALARDVLRIVTECGLPVAVKTSGSRGLHLMIALPPQTSYDTSARLAMRIAQVVAAARPERATVERSLGARPTGTIYVDAMQNARGKSAACAYSVRAKPGAPVSAPLRTSELTERLRIGAFTVATMPARVARLGDVYGEALRQRPTARTLTRALQVLDSMLAAPTPRRRQSRSRRGGADAGSTV